MWPGLSRPALPWPAPEPVGPDPSLGACHGRVRGCVTPPAAQPHPNPCARLCTSCALPVACGEGEAGVRGGRAGSPPDEGAEGLEGSRVSCQPVIQLQTPILNETFGEMDTRAHSPGVGRRGGAAGGEGVMEGGHPQPPRQEEPGRPCPFSRPSSEAGQGSGRHISLRARPHPFSRQGQGADKVHSRRKI